MITTLGAMSFNGFGKVRRGLEVYNDPNGLADKIEEHLAWMAIAGEVNNDEIRRSVIVDHLFRAYPDLSSDTLGASVNSKEEALSLIMPKLEQFRKTVGHEALTVLAGEDAAITSFVGHANEEVLGHPLRCCIFMPNIDLEEGWPAGVIARPGVPRVQGDMWQSVVKLTGDDYRRYNQAYGRPGGKLLCAQFVTFEHTTTKLEVTRMIAQETSPNQYTLVEKDLKRDRQTTNFITKTIDEAYALALRRRYDWEVEFAMSDKRTGVVVTTDAAGAQEMLATRTKAPKSRRAALVHWVREHWRKGRQTAPSAPANPTLIRSHMRGMIECEYGGLYCRIYPSQFDLDRASNGAKFEKRIEASKAK
jgi:hypothetical protein